MFRELGERLVKLCRTRINAEKINYKGILTGIKVLRHSIKKESGFQISVNHENQRPIKAFESFLDAD
jgi:hypothetical protein